MTDLISGDALSTLAQVVMIDLVLAGDNAVVIGLAAAGLPDKQRKRAILIGIATATILRIVGHCRNAIAASTRASARRGPSSSVGLLEDVARASHDARRPPRRRRAARRERV